MRRTSSVAGLQSSHFHDVVIAKRGLVGLRAQHGYPDVVCGVDLQLVHLPLGLFPRQSVVVPLQLQIANDVQVLQELVLNRADSIYV